MRTPRRPRGSRLGAALTSVVLLLTLASRAPAWAAGSTTPVAPGTDAAVPASAAPAAKPSSSARIDVVSETPWVAPAGSFLLTAEVSRAPAGAELVATLHTQRLADRDAFSKSLYGVDLGTRTANVPPIELDTITPDREGRLRVTVVVALKQAPTGPRVGGVLELSRGLAGAGVYPIELTLLDADHHRLINPVITHLVRLPDAGKPAARLRTALVLDVHAKPTIGPTGRTTVTSHTFDQVASIADVLASHADEPLTIDPTPETIEALQRTSTQTRGLLDTLRDNLTDRQVIDGPYVDLPYTSWIDAGLGDQLTQERSRGDDVLTKLLGPPDSTSWIAAADLNRNAATALWEQGIREVVVQPGTFSTITPSAKEPTLARPFRVSTSLPTPLDAVALDGRLQSAFSPFRQSDPQLTAYQVLAELSMIENEDPAEARGIVLATPPGWRPSQSFLDTLLAGLGDDPLLEPVTLHSLFDEISPVHDGGRPTAPIAERGLSSPIPAPSLGSYPQQLAEAQENIASFAQIVGSDTAQLTQWNQRLLMSASSDLSDHQRTAYLTTIAAIISGRLASVDAPSHQTVTLTAREGDIPLTLRNRLSTPVHVALLFQSGSRLEFPRGNPEAETLQPGTQQIELRVRTRSPGDTPLVVRVQSPDGNLALTSAHITVRSTAVSGIGYVLSVGAALFLLIWWARHWRRDRRARREAISAAAT